MGALHACNVRTFVQKILSVRLGRKYSAESAWASESAGACFHWACCLRCGNLLDDSIHPRPQRFRLCTEILHGVDKMKGQSLLPELVFKVKICLQYNLITWRHHCHANTFRSIIVSNHRCSIHVVYILDFSLQLFAQC
jgi:hypothetical protein